MASLAIPQLGSHALYVLYTISDSDSCTTQFLIPRDAKTKVHFRSWHSTVPNYIHSLLFLLLSFYFLHFSFGTAVEHGANNNRLLKCRVVAQMPCDGAFVYGSTRWRRWPLLSSNMYLHICPLLFIFFYFCCSLYRIQRI